MPNDLPPSSLFGFSIQLQDETVHKAMFLTWLFVALPAKTWDLFCAGDVMLNGISTSVPVFKGISVPREAVFYANLEIPLTNVKERTPHKSLAEVKAKKQFILTASPKHIRDLISAGIDVVSLGNNHAMDGGASGVKQMLSLLDREGIKHAGAGENWAKAVEPAIVIAPDGTRVAFISYLSFLSIEALRKCTPAKANAPGIATLTTLGLDGLPELGRLKSIVDKVRQQADLVVVALHWGVERQPFPAAYQVSLGRLFVDAGADVVLGAHPHVLQPAERYRGKPIIYSLGNFVNPGGGESAIYKLTFDKSKFLYANIIPVRYSGGAVSYSKQSPATISARERSLQNKIRSKYSNGLTTPTTDYPNL